MIELWNDNEWGKPKYWGKNLSEGHFFHHKSQVDWSGIEPRPATNCLGHGTAFLSPGL